MAKNIGASPHRVECLSPADDLSSLGGTGSSSTTETGDNMSNTIELLEAIGRDASLRHASAEDLSQALTGLKASDALKLAAISGDEGHLSKELGHGDVKTTHSVNNNVGGDCDDDDDDADDGDGKGDDDPGSAK